MRFIKGITTECQEEGPISLRAFKTTAEEFLKGVEEYEDSGSLLTSSTEFTNNKLSDVSDEGSYEIPSECEVQQLIIRREVSTFVPTTFLVQRDLWDKMSDFQKAVAVTHEAMYKYMLDTNQTNSFVARNFNQLLLKGSFKQMSLKEYIDLRLEFRLSRRCSSEYKLLPIVIEEIEFPGDHVKFDYYESGKLRATAHYEDRYDYLYS